MFDHLQIYSPLERALVGAADVAIWPLRLLRWPARAPIRRVLLLRLERIGDLLMTLDALRLLRAWLPDAEIDLATGHWNVPLAQLVPELTRVITANAPWLAREGGASWADLIEDARPWRGTYDLVINFEPDIRSNFLSWLTFAPRRVGYGTGGGGAFLTDASAYDPAQHVAENARALVARALGRPVPAGPIATGPWPMLRLPAEAAARAAAVLGEAARPLIGVHASGGRESKQWHPDRFAAVARNLAISRGGTIVLTGTPAERALVDRVRGGLDGVRVIDASGAIDLVTLAALLGELDLFLSSDTGPMHLAAAMGTPLVALYGPSDPRRYGPLANHADVLRIDLPCSPCGQVRLPPERCRGHVPDCLDGIDIGRVTHAALAMLDRTSAARTAGTPAGSAR
jgi:lipopolysaccharide heptosyltransferase II